MPTERDDATRVFINCPYDSCYAGFMRALIFIVHDCGFEADYALRDGNGAQSRLEQILNCLNKSKLSIHDISSAESSVKMGRRTRLNMSFECGLAFGIGYSTFRECPDRAVLVLSKSAEEASVSLSDISGCNPAIHGGEMLNIFMQVRQFLASKHPNPHEEIRDHQKLMRRFRSFDQHLKKKCGYAQKAPVSYRRRAKTMMSRQSKVSYKNLMTMGYIRDWHMAAIGWIATHQG